MVLLPQAQAFILQLVHHPVEHLHNTIGFCLPHRCKPATEILFTQQLHPTRNAVERFYHLPVKIKQDNQTERNHSFSYIQKRTFVLKVKDNKIPQARANSKPNRKNNVLNLITLPINR